MDNEETPPSVRRRPIEIPTEAGIVAFIIVEKLVRYVEECSGGESVWGHHHHNNTNKFKDDDHEHESNHELSHDEKNEKISKNADKEKEFDVPAETSDKISGKNSLRKVLVRFPSGVRKDRRFQCTTRIQSLYDYVDYLGFLEVNGYSLVSNFPRTVYGRDKLALSLKEAGLHPQASLYVELN